jgi:hypothetical protein
VARGAVAGCGHGRHRERAARTRPMSLASSSRSPW